MTQKLPQLVHQPDALRAAVASARAAGKRIGLVPTMGALHAGHLSLVEAARRECDWVVVTIFVNPTQFAPSEDFAAYPRTLQADLETLAPAGVDLVFAPSNEAMYLPGYDTYVDVGHVAQTLEGAVRPTHFRGVATVVLKLFHLVPADVAYFGQKDYQQTLVVRQMVGDLDLPIAIRVCPTVREPDGLALSSRNAYLSPDERKQAAAIAQGLQLAADEVNAGRRDAAAIQQKVIAHLQAAGLEVQYVALVRDGTVEPVERVEGPTVAAVAALCGDTRLIDNRRIR